MTRKILVPCVILSFAMIGGLVTFAAVAMDDDDDDDKAAVITLKDAPAAVRAAINTAGTEKDVTQISRESHDGLTTYEVTLISNGQTSELAISESGEVMEITRFVDAASLPPAATAAIRKAYPAGSIKEAESVQVFVYEVVVTSNGKDHEVVIAANGQMDDDDDEDEDDDNDAGR